MEKKQLKSKKHKNRWWKIFLWTVFIIVFLIIIAFCVFLYFYLKPKEYITTYYWSDKKQIKVKETRCYVIPPLSDFNNRFWYEACWDNISYYENWEIKENKYYYKDHYEHSYYDENWQKKFECSFKKMIIKSKSWEGVYQYESSIEPCIFYDEHGQIQKKYWEGKIEKEFFWNMDPKAWYFPWIRPQVNRWTYYNENGDLEKREFYEIGYPFDYGLLERDISTVDWIKKEHYLPDWDLWLVEYYDNDWNLISNRLYETNEYDERLDIISKTFYDEDGNIEKTEKYIYDGDYFAGRKLKRLEEYDNEWYITHIERY